MLDFSSAATTSVLGKLCLRLAASVSVVSAVSQQQAVLRGQEI